VQRLVVNQINGADDGYSGNVTYPTNAPWVDWGPYLWANGPSISTSTGVYWCNGQVETPCLQERDFRYGDIINDPIAFWGDYTHPTAWAAKRVADPLVFFIGKDPNHIKPGSPFVLPWIQQ
jgi:hypothetical protein